MLLRGQKLAGVLVDIGSMEWMGETLQIAFGVGLATTFDDNLYLSGFFSEVNRDFHPRHVAAGEFIGFTVLVLISLLGLLLGFAIPSRYLGLLGLLPILIGLRNLATTLSPGVSLPAIATRAGRPLGAPQRRKDAPGFLSRRPSLIELLRDRRTYGVSLVTISNGSNNLSIYIPLFASLTLVQVAVVIPVLYGFVAIWLLMSFALSRAPGLSLVLNRYARFFFPFFLVWLGIRILVDCGSLPWLRSLIA